METQYSRTALMRSMFLPPGQTERLSGEKLRMHYLYRLIIVASFLLINVLIFFVFRRASFVRRDVLDVFVFTNLGPMALDLALSAVFMRRPNRFFQPMLLFCTFLEIFAACVWTQMTGSISSYVLAIVFAAPLFFRLLYNYWVSTVAVATAVVVMGAVFVLESVGTLPYASFFYDARTAYVTPDFKHIVMISMASAMFVGFAGMNVMAAQFKRSQAELVQVQAKLRQANENLQLGRLSGTILDDYELADLLGRGGMGEVYAGRCLRDGREVAVKLLLAHLGGNAEMRARLRREADVARQMPPGTAATLIEHGISNEGYEYMVMERLHGEDLGALLRRRGSLPLAETVAILRGIATALDAAHALGVVHRDLKPPNVFICNPRPGATSPDVRLLDFGVARIMELAGTQFTATAAILGTPGYLAPEQATGGELTSATDVFALGCIAYRALTGSSAFAARQPAAAIRQVLVHQPLAPSQIVPDLPTGVDDVIAIALAVDALRRYRRASDMVADLEAVALGQAPPHLVTRAAGTLRPSIENEPTLTAVSQA
jgi:hypothetical protein